MMKTLAFALAALAACGSSKQDAKADRDTLCRAGKAAFVSGMTDQISRFEANGAKDSAEGYRLVLAKAEPRFDGFCHELSDAEVTCVENMPADMSDPKCAHAVQLMKHELLGL